MFILLLLLPLPALVSGHGRLLEPPSRASMWRLGFHASDESLHDDNDNNNNCGGSLQPETGGNCGVCGDAEHEAPGGTYATGTIVHHYTVGQTIDVTVEITANHHGSFTFRLCSVEQDTGVDPVDPLQECFNLNHDNPRGGPLLTSSGSETWPLPNTNTGDFHLQVTLPAGLSCDHCVLQWTYRTANPTCDDTAAARHGCGLKQTFRACADISIGDTVSDTHEGPSHCFPNPAWRDELLSWRDELLPETATRALPAPSVLVCGISYNVCANSDAVCTHSYVVCAHSYMTTWCQDICGHSLLNCPDPCICH